MSKIDWSIVPFVFLMTICLLTLTGVFLYGVIEFVIYLRGL